MGWYRDKGRYDAAFNRWLASYDASVLGHQLSELKHRASEKDKEFQREMDYIKHYESTLGDPNKSQFITEESRKRYKLAQEYINKYSGILQQTEEGMERMVDNIAKQYYTANGQDIRDTAPVYSTAKYPSPGAIRVKSFKPEDIPTLPQQSVQQSSQSAQSLPVQPSILRQFGVPGGASNDIHSTPSTLPSLLPSSTDPIAERTLAKQAQDKMREKAIEDFSIDMQKKLLQQDILKNKEDIDKRNKVVMDETGEIKPRGFFSKNILPFLSTAGGYIGNRIRANIPEYVGETRKMEAELMPKLEQMEALEPGFIDRTFRDYAGEVREEIRIRNYQKDIDRIRKYRKSIEQDNTR